MLKAAFLLAMLFVAGAYTFMAFTGLEYLSSAGRLGPGFFPRIIGLTLIALCLYSLYADVLRAPDADRQEAARWRDPAVIALLSFGFIALLDVLGGLFAMILFMFASLSYLNRHRLALNAAIAVTLPVCAYLLFHTWLNAAVPRGLLPLPI